MLKAAITSKNGSNGKPIQTLELTYTNATSGAIESKKLVLFYNKVVCDALATAKMDDVFTITSEKEGEYWVWKSAVQAAPGAQPQAQQVPGAPTTKAAYTPAAKSTYETPEERAKRQVLIVRQSALNASVALLTSGKELKQPPSRELILQEAQAFVDWVFASPTAAAQFAEMDDDIPE